MKKIVILSLLGISLSFANECPDLSKVEKDPLVKLKIIELFKNKSPEYVAYAEIISYYNKNGNYENYFNIEELKKLSDTPIFKSVLKEIKKREKSKEEEKKYKDFLININKKDLNWCNKIL